MEIQFMLWDGTILTGWQGWLAAFLLFIVAPITYLGAVCIAHVKEGARMGIRTPNWFI